jgi:hypothetical protein
LKSFRQERYKKLSVESSCSNYLIAIASKLSNFYEFDYRYKVGRTIGDVLAAKDGVEGEVWDKRQEEHISRLMKMVLLLKPQGTTFSQRSLA